MTWQKQEARSLSPCAGGHFSKFHTGSACSTVCRQVATVPLNNLDKEAFSGQPLSRSDQSHQQLLSNKVVNGSGKTSLVEKMSSVASPSIPEAGVQLGELGQLSPCCGLDLPTHRPRDFHLSSAGPFGLSSMGLLLRSEGGRSLGICITAPMGSGMKLSGHFMVIIPFSSRRTKKRCAITT